MRGGLRRQSLRCSDRKRSGPVNMPTLEILAVGGLSYTRLHCATLRSPSRRDAADRGQPSIGRAGQGHPNRRVDPQESLMDWLLIAIVGVIVLALLFDFTNGFHDAANSVATVVATRRMIPRGQWS